MVVKVTILTYALLAQLDDHIKKNSSLKNERLIDR